MKAFAVTRRQFLVQSSVALVALTAGGAALLAPSTAMAGPPTPTTAESVAKSVQKFYDGTKTYRANFKQVYFIKVQNKKKESKGRVVFEKPGKMSFVYDEPNGNRVVSDGKIIKVYEKEAEQMYETNVSKSQYPAALAFLMGEGKLEKDFKLKLLDAATMKFEGGHVLEAVPKEVSPAYEKMLLYVDGPTSQVRRVIVIDAQSNRNRFDFTDPVVNKPVEAKEFDFKPPPGTKIMKP
ncbi:MAG: outer membrane lipoprotein carrier protein LolA [Polyangiaceae bacterium]|nr:outer membrane lipoprotein carrier protein LolA [Polyangiaceae bacterium]